MELVRVEPNLPGYNTYAGVMAGKQVGAKCWPLNAAEKGVHLRVDDEEWIGRPVSPVEPEMVRDVILALGRAIQIELRNAEAPRDEELDSIIYEMKMGQKKVSGPEPGTGMSFGFID